MDDKTKLHHISKFFEFAIGQLDEYLEHPKADTSLEGIKKHLTMRFSSAKETLEDIFKEEFELLVLVTDDGEVLVDLSSPLMTFLRASGIVSGNSYEEVLLSYYEAKKNKEQSVKDRKTGVYDGGLNKGPAGTKSYQPSSFVKK